MATIDINEMIDARQPTHRDHAAGLRGFWQRVTLAYRRHRHQQALVKLARSDPRLLRDIGIDPATVYGALEGTWDEVPGDRWRGFENL